MYRHLCLAINQAWTQSFADITFADADISAGQKNRCLEIASIHDMHCSSVYLFSTNKEINNKCNILIKQDNKINNPYTLSVI